MKQIRPGGIMNLREETTAKIVEAIRAGVPPWHKGWTVSGLPRNERTSKPYRGINRIILGMQGYEDGRWVTYRQAKEAGYQVRKGERATRIVRLVEVGRSRDGEDAPGDVVAEKNNQRLVMRTYAVFNAAQVDGMPALPTRAHAIAPVDGADAIVEGMKATGLKVFYGSPTAYYSPHVDTVRLPAKADFHSDEHYSVLLHECAHATGAQHRLNRDMTARYGTPAYAREELRAEIASAMLSAEVGIPLGKHHIDSHAAYVASWIAVLESDPNEIFRAAAEAQGICDYMQAHALKIEPAAANDPTIPSPVPTSSPRPALRM